MARKRTSEVTRGVSTTVVWSVLSMPYLTIQYRIRPPAQEVSAARGPNVRKGVSSPSSSGREIGPMTAATSATMMPSTPPKREPGLVPQRGADRDDAAGELLRIAVAILGQPVRPGLLCGAGEPPGQWEGAAGPRVHRHSAVDCLHRGACHRRVLLDVQGVELVRAARDEDTVRSRFETGAEVLREHPRIDFT